MFGFVQSWIGPRANPIGIDLGSDCVRLAQVQWTHDSYRLVAAASLEMPPHAAADSKTQLKAIAEALRDLPRRSEFRSRDAVLALPTNFSSVREFQFDRSATVDEINSVLLPAALKPHLAYAFEEAVIRSIVIEDAAFSGSTQNDRRVIVQVVNRDAVVELIRIVESAGLTLVGMTVQTQAIVDCFAHVYRRRSDADVTTCFIDIGWRGTRAVIARGQQILGACDIAIGGEALCKAGAIDAGTSEIECKRQRISNAARESVAARELMQSVVMPLAVSSKSGHDTSSSLDSKLNELTTSLKGFTAEHESRCPLAKIDRLLFVGGESRQRQICNRIATAVGTPVAQLGDPLVRLGRTSDVGVQSGIDRREPQPAWAIAMGLTLGPALPPATRRDAREDVRSERTRVETKTHPALRV